MKRVKQKNNLIIKEDKGTYSVYTLEGNCIGIRLSLANAEKMCARGYTEEVNARVVEYAGEQGKDKCKVKVDIALINRSKAARKKKVEEILGVKLHATDKDKYLKYMRAWGELLEKIYAAYVYPKPEPILQIQEVTVMQGSTKLGFCEVCNGSNIEHYWYSVVIPTSCKLDKFLISLKSDKVKVYEKRDKTGVELGYVVTENKIIEIQKLDNGTWRYKLLNMDIEPHFTGELERTTVEGLLGGVSTNKQSVASVFNQYSGKLKQI